MTEHPGAAARLLQQLKVKLKPKVQQENYYNSCKLMISMMMIMMMMMMTIETKLE